MVTIYNFARTSMPDRSRNTMGEVQIKSPARKTYVFVGTRMVQKVFYRENLLP
jgi:hypothetical protein